jgi:hypothetical protein
MHAAALAIVQIDHTLVDVMASWRRGPCLAKVHAALGIVFATESFRTTSLIVCGFRHRMEALLIDKERWQ